MPPTITEWISGKDVLVTGGTGFMGKVLIEKLLRSSPGINRIYLIARPKKGKTIEERKTALFKEELFQPLLKMYPNATDKVIFLPGDVAELECGLSKEHQQELFDNVSIVFHSAASVRFDDPLTTALRLNTRGTHELIKLSKQMKKIEVFQYISTTYCNVNVSETIQERVYPSFMPWKDMLYALENDPDTLDNIAIKALGTQPNTYTFTKSLAENIVKEANDDIPCVIVRPSIVMPSIQEPIPGWVDNINGPISITIGVCKGVLRVMAMKPEGVLDFLPVDISINGLIVGAWARRFAHDNPETVMVWNEAYGSDVQCTNAESVVLTTTINAEAPMENFLWYPFMILTTDPLYFNILFFFLQVLPALFLDGLLVILRKKPMVFRMNIKIYNAIKGLASFTTKPFSFDNDLMPVVDDILSPEDIKTYPMIAKRVDFTAEDYTRIALGGIRKYLFKEPEDKLDQKRKVLRRLKYIHYGTIFALSSYLIWKITMISKIYVLHYTMPDGYLEI